MNAAVEVGARSTRKHARLHIAGGCGWATSTPLVGKLVRLTATNAHRCCRNCRKAIRTAIDAVRMVANRAQGYGRAVSHSVRVALDILAEAFASPAEIARQAELLARIAAPVAPRTFAEMRAVNLRTLPQPTEPARYVNLAA